MDKYQQLQDFLNECIKLGWKSNLFFLEVKEVYCTNLGLESEYGSTFYMSYHDLFSKDSGIMELVERKPTMSFGQGNLEVRYNEMSTITANEKIDYFLLNARLPE